MTGAAPALVTTGNRVSPPPRGRRRVTNGATGPQSRDVGLRRAQVQDTARKLSPHLSVALCGSVGQPMGTADLWMEGDGRICVHGVKRCGSPWECPTCASRIGQRRAAELNALGAAHRAAGGGLYHLILTVPHDQGLPLAPLRRHVSRAWQYCQAGAPWKRFSARWGIIGMVRGADTTYGRHGWHPHLHILLFAAGSWTAREMVEIRQWLWLRWCRAIAKPVPGIGQLRAPSHRRGTRLVRASIAGYLAEASICWGDELASTTMKQTRARGQVTPWQLLQALATREFGSHAALRRALATWGEWARGMRGARQLTYSRGLRERYGLRGAADDATAAAEQLPLRLEDAPPARCRARVDAWSWNHLVLRRPTLYVAVLATAGDPEIADADVQELIDALVEQSRASGRAPPVRSLAA